MLHIVCQKVNCTGVFVPSVDKCLPYITNDGMRGLVGGVIMTVCCASVGYRNDEVRYKKYALSIRRICSLWTYGRSPMSVCSYS